jgi:EpsI family protein
LSDKVVHVGNRSDGLEVREFVVRKDGETRVVHFWYRTQNESGFTSTPLLRLRQFWSRLTTNRGDGALVRLSTPVEGDDLTGARIRLFGLDTAVEHALDGIWPGALREEPGRVDQRG